MSDMGVNTDVYVRKDQVNNLIGDISIFTRLLRWSCIRWYRFEEDVLGGIDLHEISGGKPYYRSEGIKSYLLRTNRRLKYREELADAVNEFDLIFAPDYVTEKEVPEIVNYVSVYTIYMRMIEKVKNEKW